MGLSSENGGLVSTKRTEVPISPSPASPSLPGREPEVKHNRKMALLSALSDGLPTLPAYVFELNSILAKTPADLKRVAEIIRTDPSLTAQVLRLCNSALMGARERITRIEHAVILVGTERLRTMVLTCSLLEYMGNRVASEHIQSFWQHSFLSAALSERLARAIGYVQPEYAYLAGLLHDIGALPLMVVNAMESKRSEQAMNGAWGESIELEREHFGSDHCEVGHWIGASWNFPPALLEAMVKHHSSREASEDPKLVAVVAVADQFCVRRGVVLGGVPPELPESENDRDQAVLQMSLPHLTCEQADQLADMMESDFLHLIQLMEFGASGLFGGGIPKNPFRESEG